MQIFDYAGHYRQLKEKVYEKYGTEHLCGNCVHTTSCRRADIQWLSCKNKKAKLMELNAPFVKDFEIQSLTRDRKDVGFVAVYDCERFEFDGYRGETDEI